MADDGKYWIGAQELLEDSWRLALAVLDSGFIPDLLVGLWRGGTPIAIAVHEVLALSGIACDHMPLRTTHYNGIDSRTATVELDIPAGGDTRLRTAARVLVVDDVFDTGLTLAAVREHLNALPATTPREVRLATVWWKPDRNRTALRPDYHLHETTRWLVFPHELCGMASDELIAHKPGITVLRDRLRPTP